MERDVAFARTADLPVLKVQEQLVTRGILPGSAVTPSCFDPGSSGPGKSQWELEP